VHFTSSEHWWTSVVAWTGCDTRQCAAGEVDTSLPLCWCVCVLVCVVTDVSITCAQPRPTHVYPHGGAGQIEGG
jgi:hypothetical protein